MYGQGTHRVHAVQYSSMSFISVYTVDVVTEQKMPTTFSLFVFYSHKSRGNNKQKQNLPTCNLCLIQLLAAEETYKSTRIQSKLRSTSRFGTLNMYHMHAVQYSSFV